MCPTVRWGILMAKVVEGEHPLFFVAFVAYLMIFLRMCDSLVGSWRRRLSCGVMEIVLEVTTLILY